MGFHRGQNLHFCRLNEFAWHSLCECVYVVHLTECRNIVFFTRFFYFFSGCSICLCRPIWIVSLLLVVCSSFNVCISEHNFISLSLEHEFRHAALSTSLWKFCHSEQSVRAAFRDTHRLTFLSHIQHCCIFIAIKICHHICIEIATRRRPCEMQLDK